MTDCCATVHDGKLHLFDPTFRGDRIYFYNNTGWEEVHNDARPTNARGLWESILLG